MMSDEEKLFNMKNGKEIKGNKDPRNLKGTIKPLIAQVVSLRKKKREHRPNNTVNEKWPIRSGDLSIWESEVGIS